jgi:hypothetical protein
LDIPGTIKSLFSDKDQDVVAIHYAEEGHIKAWRVDRLKAAAKDIEATEMELAKLQPELRIWFGEEAGLVKLAELVPHLARIEAADTSVPIIVFDENRIVDGAHRFVRALLEGKTSIPSKLISAPPLPDLVIPLTPDGNILAN